MEDPAKACQYKHASRLNVHEAPTRKNEKACCMECANTDFSCSLRFASHGHGRARDSQVVRTGPGPGRLPEVPGPSPPEPTRLAVYILRLLSAAGA